ncbi:thiamine phosphate synthase [Rossellomorea sp. SC111]|uniref:thiamine phosphate synthase n=1 Tax=Rossellomorea sp. SC111 TaxID=2968985 RepID=UPI00215AFD8D|nr:thiamine phosphate synthase [Rossellomorea sp. SC111]MCR8847331.1 thiamine phosphate synthase [Rossellomorea sp. SC111]
MNLRKCLKLYFVMGSQNCERPPALVLEEALSCGVTMFQFRDKGIRCLKGKPTMELALELQHLCQKYSVPFIINDDVELALLLNADGVHIGQEDESVKGVREKIGDKILGVSAHNVEEARLALESGADYLGVGPMFHTITKNDCRIVKGPRVIESIRAEGIHLPLVGIGGIHPGNVHEVIEAGSDGVAVISAISKRPEQTRSLFQSVEDSLLQSM